MRLSDFDPERTLGCTSLIHLDADGGDGGNLAPAITVSRATCAAARHLADHEAE
jgi:hypothetical protein